MVLSHGINLRHVESIRIFIDSWSFAMREDSGINDAGTQYLTLLIRNVAIYVDKCPGKRESI